MANGKGNLVNIKLHGKLGEAIGEKFNLAVKSVSEALRAINIISKKRFFAFLKDNDKNGIRYRVLINGRDFVYDKTKDLTKEETVLNSELTAYKNNLKTIDIIPVLEGNDEGFLGIILGVLLVIVGIILVLPPGAQPFGAALIVAGLGLIAGGVISLLSKPPAFQDFREFDEGTSRESYLFNGPVNTTREGGPVPIGYGELIIGSQVISASFDISDKSTEDNPLTL